MGAGQSVAPGPPGPMTESPWQKWIGDNDEFYWYNPNTGEYSYEAPEEGCEWEQVPDFQTEEMYWINTRTGRTQWTPPTGNAPIDPSYLGTVVQLQRLVGELLKDQPPRGSGVAVPIPVTDAPIPVALPL